MNRSIQLDDTSIDIIKRANAGLVREQAKLQPMEKSYFHVVGCTLGILIAVIAEMVTLTFGLHARFPVLSTGADLGSELLHIRIGICAVLLLGHALVHDHVSGTDTSIRSILGKFHLIPIVAVVAGIGIFVGTTMAQATGGDDQHIGLVGWAIGLACSFLFTASFLICNKLIGYLLPAIETILSGRAQQAKVDKIEQQLKAVELYSAKIETLQREISDREDPQVLREKAAAEAGTIAGQVAAEAHDEWASHVALADMDVRPTDVVNLRDTSLEALNQRQAYLKSLTFEYFLDLLNKKGV